MTRDEIATLLARHQDAFHRRDADALAGQHAEKGTYESPAHGTVSGRGPINDLYRYWFTAFPDLKLTWQPPLIDGDRAAVFWSFAGTAHGPFFGIVGAGTRVEMKGASDYTFENGLIRSVRTLYDFSGVLLKTGVLKVKPGA
jgi:predicted ester cyclase